MMSLDLNRYFELSVACQVPSSEVKEISDRILTIEGFFGYLHSFVSSVMGRF